MEPCDLQARVEALTKISHTLTHSEETEVLQLTEALEKVLEGKAAAILRRHVGRPVLAAFISDGWSTDISRTTTERIDGQLVTNIGWFRHEFVLERGVLRTLSAAGEHGFGLVCRAPRALRGGRDAWTMFSSGSELMGTLRGCGHRGPCWNIYVMDGHLLHATFRKFRSFHDLYYDEEHGMVAPDEHDTFTLQNSDLMLGISCKVHAAHNSIAWSTRLRWETQLCKDAHIVVSSLLRGSSAIHDTVRDFITRHVVFMRREDPPCAVAELWRTLDIPEKLIPYFVLADPEWDSGRNHPEADDTPPDVWRDQERDAGGILVV